MIIAVKTREFKRDLDYDWEDYFPSDRTLVSEAGMLHRALEGADDSSRFVALLRPTTGAGVTLGVSVSTVRKDAVGRPIRTMAFLRAESQEEADLLAAFFAECLRKPDTETLYNAESGVAKAVESLYQTKKPDDFLRFCRTLPTANGSGAKPTGRWEIPRKDVGSRQAMAKSLPALIGGGEPFLIALTDRLPTDVLASLGSMFDKAVVRIFSKATSIAKPIPGPHAEGGPSPRVLAAAIGGIVLVVLLLVAAGRSCAKHRGEDKAPGGTNAGISETSGGGGFGVSEANATASQAESGEPGGSLSAAFTNAPPEAMTVTNPPTATESDMKPSTNPDRNNP